MQPQLAHQVAMPGFTTEQTASLQANITAAVNEALDKHFGPLYSTQQATRASQQSIPPAPQAKKEEEKEKQSHCTKPLWKTMQRPWRRAPSTTTACLPAARALTASNSAESGLLTPAFSLPFSPPPLPPFSAPVSPLFRPPNSATFGAWKRWRPRAKDDSCTARGGIWLIN